MNTLTAPAVEHIAQSKVHKVNKGGGSVCVFKQEIDSMTFKHSLLTE